MKLHRDHRIVAVTAVFAVGLPVAAACFIGSRTDALAAHIGKAGNVTASIGRVDFVFDSCRLVVEADGRRYHSQKTATLRDRERDLELLAAGWQLLRVDWWQLVNDGPNVARLLGQILRRRSTS